MRNEKRIGMMAGLAFAAAIASAQGIEVNVNGDPVNFPDQEPIYRSGRVLVPLRGVFEKLGARVTWHQTTQTVRAIRGNEDIRVRIGSHVAYQDGVYKRLDVAPILMNGTTMVPLRFLSESLGAQVGWNDADRVVSISTDGDIAFNNGGRRHNDDRGTAAETIQNDNVVRLGQDTVLPITLNTRLSSNSSERGTKFSGTVRDNEDSYLGLPVGTRIEGHVITARPQDGSDPGILELGFDRLRLPDGRAVPIQGSLVSLNSNDIERRDDGTIVAKPSAKDNRGVYAGYGAGAGLIIGVLTKRPLENTVLGGILGYAVGALQKPDRRPSDVRLDPGAKFGVRLERNVAVNFGR